MSYSNSFLQEGSLLVAGSAVHEVEYRPRVVVPQQNKKKKQQQQHCCSWLLPNKNEEEEEEEEERRRRDDTTTTTTVMVTPTTTTTSTSTKSTRSRKQNRRKQQQQGQTIHNSVLDHVNCCDVLSLSDNNQENGHVLANDDSEDDDEEEEYKPRFEVKSTDIYHKPAMKTLISYKFTEDPLEYRTGVLMNGYGYIRFYNGVDDGGNAIVAKYAFEITQKRFRDGFYRPRDDLVPGRRCYDTEVDQWCDLVKIDIETGAVMVRYIGEEKERRISPDTLCGVTPGKGKQRKQDQRKKEDEEEVHTITFSGATIGGHNIYS